MPNREFSFIRECGRTKYCLKVLCNIRAGHIELQWRLDAQARPAAEVRIACTGRDEITWTTVIGLNKRKEMSPINPISIDTRLRELLRLLPTTVEQIRMGTLQPGPGSNRVIYHALPAGCTI